MDNARQMKPTTQMFLRKVSPAAVVAPEWGIMVLRIKRSLVPPRPASIEKRGTSKIEPFSVDNSFLEVQVLM
jgi:hypothetical protein